MNAAAGESDIMYAGDLGLEPRTYLDNGRFPGQEHDTTISAFVRPEARWQSRDADHQFAFRGFARQTLGGDDRSHADVRDLYWRWRAGEVQVLAGINTVFWGVTESRHLIDVVNQQDIKEDIDREEKLGQPMLSVSGTYPWGSLSYYLLPYFREIDYPEEDSRVLTRPPLPVGSATYESSAEERRLDHALRYSHYAGAWDLGLYYFNGTSRDPNLRLSADGERLIPHYSTIEQAGMDVQYTRGAWLWKLEALYRRGGADSFAAAVGGFEYTRYQVLGTAVDLGFLVEYLYDGRNAGAPPAPFENDVFIGLRAFLNDTSDTTALLGTIYDLDRHETFTSLEIDTRLSTHWSLHGEVRVTDDAAANSPLIWPAADDYLEVALVYGF